MNKPFPFNQMPKDPAVPYGKPAGHSDGTPREQFIALQAMIRRARRNVPSDKPKGE